MMLESKGRALRPEDVMILVKRRGELASLIVARLYAEGVPVAGVDRLRLNAPLAVQDLLAAVRFVLQPEDDLSLASLLVSPLIGWSQDELMAAALRPRHASLWRHLRDTARDRIAPLEALLNRADFTTPYRFLEEILSGPLARAAETAAAAGRGSARSDRGTAQRRAQFRECRDAFAPAIPRLVRSRRCRDRPRCGAAGRARCG